jgi:O-acetyl-ADP-ribose deacetylase (regulator of RNase III)
MNTEIKAIKGDITKYEVEAIVNAANKTLSGGGGVDGAIHKAAGNELKAACQKLGGCEKGEAKITPGFKLPARYVIHTVGPEYGSEDGAEDELLASCYTSCLSLAMEHNLESIAFPNISTGVFRYPRDEAVDIAVNSVWQWVKSHDYYQFDKITFVCFSEEDYKIYEEYLANFKFV